MPQAPDDRPAAAPRARGTASPGTPAGDGVAARASRSLWMLYRNLPPVVRGLPLALALGTLGGWIATGFDLPLAWLIGAVCATMLSAFAGLELYVPNGFRNGMIAVLGLLVGSGFTPDLLAHIHRWAFSIGGVLLYTITIALVVMALLRGVAGMRRIDAFFSALPGGMANVVFVGSELGADLRVLSLVHSVRVVLVCFSVPLWFKLVVGVTAAGPRGGGLGAITLWDVALFAAAGIVGYLLARRLRIPAPYLLGPLLLSAAIHMAGLTTARPPGILINAAQVVVGSAIGCRFVGVSFRRVLANAGHGIASTALMLAVGLGFAAATATLTGIPFDALVLAFAPGGLPEMTLIALTLQVDPALVVSHHLARVLFINLMFPVVFKAVPPSAWREEKA